MIGKINYCNLTMSIAGITLDEINFCVYKKSDNFICPFWDDIIDLKIIDVVGYGQFETHIDKNTDQNIVKEK